MITDGVWMVACEGAKPLEAAGDALIALEHRLAKLKHTASRSSFPPSMSDQPDSIRPSARPKGRGGKGRRNPG